MNSLRCLRTIIEHTFPVFSRGDGFWCFWMPAWGSLCRGQCRILSVDSGSHLKNGYSSQHTAGFCFEEILLWLRKIMTRLKLFVLHVLLVDMLSCIEDWFATKNIREDEVSQTLHKISHMPIKSWCTVYDKRF